MSNSTPTIQTVGFRRLCRGYLRVLFSGFYSQIGASLLSAVVGLGRFWSLVDLFIEAVVPTICFNYLSYYLLGDVKGRMFLDSSDVKSRKLAVFK